MTRENGCEVVVNVNRWVAIGVGGCAWRSNEEVVRETMAGTCCVLVVEMKATGIKGRQRLLHWQRELRYKLPQLHFVWKRKTSPLNITHRLSISCSNISDLLSSHRNYLVRHINGFHILYLIGLVKALRFGDLTKEWLTGFGFVSISGLALSGYNAHLGWPYYACLTAASGQMAWQIYGADLSNRADCNRKLARIPPFLLVGVAKISSS
ncbi:uncharacterized protein [Spinacia oleracea]|uniref:Uncharacterized protein n=1 Tax=Spinacia oleracea TaxID=3562 RepID=A0ABM3QUT7_SPIOL|nr:uncharacterized protein LOC130462582 [Spinacia oleracea]